MTVAVDAAPVEGQAPAPDVDQLMADRIAIEDDIDLLASKLKRVLWALYLIMVITFFFHYFVYGQPITTSYVLTLCLHFLLLGIGLKGARERSTCLLMTYFVVKLVMLIFVLTFFVYLTVFIFFFAIREDQQCAEENCSKKTIELAEIDLLSLVLTAIVILVPLTLSVCSIILAYRLRKVLLIVQRYDQDVEQGTLYPADFGSHHHHDHHHHHLPQDVVDAHHHHNSHHHHCAPAGAFNVPTDGHTHHNSHHHHHTSEAPVDNHHHSNHHHHHLQQPIQLQPVYYYPSPQSGSAPAPAQVASPYFYYPQLMTPTPNAPPAEEASEE